MTRTCIWPCYMTDIIFLIILDNALVSVFLNGNLRHWNNRLNISGKPGILPEKISEISGKRLLLQQTSYL